jgi:hypothetical protein
MSVGVYVLKNVMPAETSPSLFWKTWCFFFPVMPGRYPSDTQYKIYFLKNAKVLHHIKAPGGRLWWNGAHAWLCVRGPLFAPAQDLPYTQGIGRNFLFFIFPLFIGGYLAKYHRKIKI